MSYTVIRNVTMIDGTGRAPRPNAAVLFRDSRISAVGDQATLALPDAPLTVIDGQGGTLLPGLIDCHVHMMFEVGGLAEMAVTPFSLNFYRSVQYMRRTLDAGITSVRDAGGADLGMKRAQETGMLAGPRLQISISVLGITGGHTDGWMPSGVNFDLFPPHPGRPDGICDGVPEVRRKVREVLRAGADIVKICATGGVLSPTDHPEFTQFSPEELAAIVQEAAYRRGVKVMAHAQGLEGIRNAVHAGIHSIEHGIFLNEEVCELMIERGTYLVPTLLAPVAVLEQAQTHNMPEYGVRKSREVVEIHAESIALAHKMGVAIAMGTDAGVMPHGSNLRELGLMTRIGMSPMEAIVASTRTAAACLGWDDRLGTLEPGKLADLVLIDGDPLADIGILADNTAIRLVVQDGQVVKNRLTA